MNRVLVAKQIAQKSDCNKITEKSR